MSYFETLRLIPLTNEAFRALIQATPIEEELEEMEIISCGFFSHTLLGGDQFYRGQS